MKLKGTSIRIRMNREERRRNNNVKKIFFFNKSTWRTWSVRLARIFFSLFLFIKIEVTEEVTLSQLFRISLSFGFSSFFSSDCACFACLPLSFNSCVSFHCEFNCRFSQTNKRKTMTIVWDVCNVISKSLRSFDPCDYSFANQKNHISYYQRQKKTN